MKRLVYAEDIKSEIDEWLDSVGYATVGKDLGYYGELIGCIEDAPTIEAVQVVHCKECKNWGTGVAGETTRVKCCKYAGYMIGENGYCVYGERNCG